MLLQLAALTYIVTIDNYATYDQPSFHAEMFDVNDPGYPNVPPVLTFGDFTDMEDGTLHVTAPGPGNYQIRVKVQDFGDLQSETATHHLDSYIRTIRRNMVRYWRVDRTSWAIQIAHIG